MQRRLHLRNKKRNFFCKKSNIFVLILISIFIGIIWLFSYANKKFTPLIMEYAEIQAGRIATLVINQAITKEVTEQINVEDLFIIIKDDAGETKSIDFNPLAVNKMLSMVTSNVQMYLRNLEDGNLDEIGLTNSSLSGYNIDKLKQGIIYEVPTGVIFGNSILYNIGPKIPVRLSLVGNIVSNIDTKITSYGINNALIEIVINISVVEQVMLPFASKKITVSTNVPVAIKLVQGQVPEYYLNGGTSGSSVLTVPVE